MASSCFDIHSSFCIKDGGYEETVCRINRITKVMVVWGRLSIMAPRDSGRSSFFIIAFGKDSRRQVVASGLGRNVGHRDELLLDNFIKGRMQNPASHQRNQPSTLPFSSHQVPS